MSVLAPLPALLLTASSLTPPPSPPSEAGPYPSDWFLRQRAWPHADIRQDSRLAAHAQATALRSFARGTPTGAWEPVGPRNIGGRVTDVACHPTDPDVVYIGAASGGVFRTTDAGSTWTPLFDDESSLSIGSLALDPTDPDVVWVGTGEPNGGGGSVSYGGTGVFRSTNAGVTWEHRGLEATRFVGRIRVDPADPSRLFVAALGSQWSPHPERGVYRTTDAGASWERVLASTDSTGAVDLVLDAGDPDRIFAVLWERSRGPDYLDYGGPTSG
ncbi:MAG TPA: glycosyl hydrolase, partial [bacterium]|nr:glycosyl hydrolase [bacterium]